MKRSLVLVAEILLMALVPNMGSMAMASSQKTSVGTKTPAKSTLKNPAKKENEADSKSWSLSSTYTYSSDQVKSSDRRASKQRLDFGGEYKLSEKWAVSIESNLQWTADGNNVRKTESNPRTDDLELGIATAGKILPQTSYTLGLSDALPTGYESRTEATKNTISAAGGLSQSMLDKKLTAGISVSASYIQQTYDSSVTSGESNPDSLYTATFSIGYSLIDHLKVDFKHMLWSFHFINGENNIARNQSSVGLGYSIKNFKVFTKYSIGNYDKGDGYKLIYFDDTRQIVSVGVAIEI